MKQPDSNLVGAFIYLAVLILFVIVNFISLFGVPYAAYCFSDGERCQCSGYFFCGKEICMADAWQFLSLRISAYTFCVRLLLFGIDRSTVPAHISDWAILLFLPFSLFSGMWYFTMFEFFAYDGGIRESLKNAWGLFTSHFSTLAILGISMALAARFSAFYLEYSRC